MVSVDTKSNDCTENFVPSCGHAECICQRITMQGSTGDPEPMSPDLKHSTAPGIPRLSQPERLYEGHTEMDSALDLFSSSSETGSLGRSISHSGCDTATVESVEKRKQKTPDQIEHARERQRLARRAKRAAKAPRTGKDHALLDGDEKTQTIGPSILDGKGQGDDPPDLFSRREGDELERMVHQETSALQASHERE